MPLQHYLHVCKSSGREGVEEDARYPSTLYMFYLFIYLLGSHNPKKQRGLQKKWTVTY